MGTKRRTRKHRGGDRISDAIRDTVRNVKHKENLQFQLQFTMFGIPYKTEFSVTRYDDSIFLKSLCVHVFMHSDRTNSGILANTNPLRPCFDPPLKTIQEPIRMTATDVLQTLKTKLTLLFQTHIEITDVATVDGVPISFFKLVRGEPSLYEKYGYEHPSLDVLRERIAQTTWGDVKHGLKDKSIVEVIESFSKEFPDLDSHPVQTILKRVPFEKEKEYKMSRKILFDVFKFRTIFLTLNRESELWKYWNNAMVFTGIEIL
jgi:hypothetical protein